MKAQDAQSAQWNDESRNSCEWDPRFWLSSLAPVSFDTVFHILWFAKRLSFRTSQG